MSIPLPFKKAKSDVSWALSEKAKHPLPDDVNSMLASSGHPPASARPPRSRPMKIRQAVSEGYKVKAKATLKLNVPADTPPSIQPRGMPVAAPAAAPTNALKRTRSDGDYLDEKPRA
ncbi:hypothetical protein HDU96_003423 [Phlyctochytrium bullatum]|nr:hypothetical protein HDU96_003423 [Phlyctochytrium bullatum]